MAIKTYDWQENELCSLQVEIQNMENLSKASYLQLEFSG